MLSQEVRFFAMVLWKFEQQRGDELNKNVKRMNKIKKKRISRMLIMK